MDLLPGPGAFPNAIHRFIMTIRCVKTLWKLRRLPIPAAPGAEVSCALPPRAAPRLAALRSSALFVVFWAALTLNGSVAFAQWPDGTGKATTLQLCGNCHKADVIQA